MLCTATFFMQASAENTSLYVAGRMRISDNGVLYVTGNIVHNGKKDDPYNFFNTGRIFLKGDITNMRGNLFEGSTESETRTGIEPKGTIDFWGKSNAQKIYSATDTVFFADMIIGNEIILQSDIYVEGKLSLISRNVQLNKNTINFFHHKNPLRKGNTGVLENENFYAQIIGEGNIYAVKRAEQWLDLYGMGFDCPFSDHGSIIIGRKNNFAPLLNEDGANRYFEVQTSLENAMPTTVSLKLFDNNIERLPLPKEALAVSRVAMHEFYNQNPPVTRYNSFVEEEYHDRYIISSTDDAVLTSEYPSIYTVAPYQCVNPPKVDLGKDVHLCIGQKTVLKAHIEYGRGYYGYYFWNGIRSEDYKLETSNDGKYIFRVEDELGCIAEDTVEVSVHPYPSPEIIKNTDLLCEDEPLQIIYTDTVAASSVVWNFGDGTTAANIDTVLKTFPIGCATYSITLNAETEYGCAASTSTQVRTEVVPSAKIAMNFLTDTIAEINAIIDSACDNNIAYKWFVDDVSVSDKKEFIFVFPKRTNYNIRLEIFTSKCSAAVDTSFEIKERAFVSFSLDRKDFCAGENVTLKNTTEINYGDFVFYWHISNGKNYTSYDSVVEKFDVQGMYIVSLMGVSDGWARTVTDTFWVHKNPEPSLPDSIFTCESYYFLVVENSILDQYFWTNENGVYIGGYPVYNARKSGKYTIVQTSNYGCVGIDSTVVILNERIKVRLGNDKITCDSITLDAGYLSEKCIWNYADTARFFTVKKSGKVVLRVEADSGCFGMDSIYVSVYKKPNASLGVDTFFCSGDSVLLVLPALSSQDCSVRWNVDNDSSLFRWVTQRGTYSVTVTDSSGYCADSSSVFVEKRQSPILNIPDVIFACNGDTVLLEMWGNASAQQIIWKLPDGSLKNGIVLSTDKEGFYGVTVTYSNTCSASGVWNVQKRETSAVSSFLMSSTADLGDSVFLVNLSYPTPLSYYWEATSGFRSEEENPICQFYRNGFYSVRLDVSNNECAVSRTKFITIGSGAYAPPQVDSSFLQDDAEKNVAVATEECDIVVSPNPSKNIFNVSIEKGFAMEYSVMTLLGKRICTGKIHENKFTINASGWHSGLYLLFVGKKVVKLIKV
jgi:PKD repeat protein